MKPMKGDTFVDPQQMSLGAEGNDWHEKHPAASEEHVENHVEYIEDRHSLTKTTSKADQVQCGITEIASESQDLVAKLEELEMHIDSISELHCSERK